MFDYHSILFEFLISAAHRHSYFCIMENLKTYYLGVFILLLILVSANTLHAQSTDSTRYFGGFASVTNNGISLIPTFSLNKPAGLVILNMGKRFTFDPEFRFSLEDGKPWSFIFWGRYKLVQQEKLRLNVGLHPGYLFSNKKTTDNNGNTSMTIATERYLASEISPSYFITKNTSIGVYYLHSRGFTESSTKSIDFITLNANFNKIDLFKSYYLKFSPQFYYLKMDDQDGYYFTATATLAKEKFPLSLQSTMNKKIESEIPSQNFIWNMSLMYSFGKQYKAI